MSGLTYKGYKTWLALAFATLAVVSIAGPACESACGDSAPDNGSSCSGTARCGSTCGEFWECKDGTWSVGVADCFPIGDARQPDANVDADAGAAHDADASDASACPDGG
jgi:hypothetical protein